MRRFFFAAAVVLASTFGRVEAQTPRRVENLTDLHRATFRLRAVDSSGRGRVGTGSLNALDGGRYLGSTNWHVVDGYVDVVAEFFGDGRPFSVPARVEWAYGDDRPTDCAVVSIQADALTAYAPPVIPLAAEGESPRVGDVILSCGCSEGRAPFAFVGYVEDYFGKVARFYPAPKGGQSGSAVLQYYPNDGWRLVGWVAYRVGDERTKSEEEMRGGIVGVDAFYAALDDGRTRTNYEVSPGSPGPPPGMTWCGLDDSLGAPDVSASGEPATLGTLNGLGGDAGILSLEELARDFSARIDASPATADSPPITFAIGSTDFATKPVASGTRVSVLFYTMDGCLACRQAEPVAERFQARGRPIRTFNVSRPEGKADADRRGVLEFPTFVCYRSDDEGASWREIARFVGVSNDLETKLEQIFSLGAQGGATGPPSASRPSTGDAARRLADLYRDSLRYVPRDGGRSQPSPSPDPILGGRVVPETFGLWGVDPDAVQKILDGLWEEKKAAVEERIRRFVANFVALNGAATFAVVWLALKLFRRKEKE